MSEKIYITNKIGLQDLHLGDALVTLNLIYNRYLITNNIIEIYGPEIIFNLINIFKYEGLKYIGRNENNITGNYKLKQFIDGFENFQSEFLNAKFCNIVGKEIKFNNLILPQYRSNKIIKDIKDLLFQFDNRSLHTLGKNKLSIKEIENVLSIYKIEEEDIFGIGGPDTIPYIENIKFKIGNLNYICNELNYCRLFIGSDSGISHLAGTMNINSIIINTHELEPNLSEINEFYNFMYRNTKIKSKKEIFKKWKHHT